MKYFEPRRPQLDLSQDIDQRWSSDSNVKELQPAAAVPLGAFESPDQFSKNTLLHV